MMIEKTQWQFMPMLVDHLLQVMEIENETFLGRWKLQTFLEELANDRAHLYVALSGSRVMGYGGILLGFEEEAHITTLAVKKEFQRQGVGTFLLRNLLQAMKDLKARKATLEVRASNQIAIHLYEKFGFLLGGRRKNYYPDGEDALIFWCKEL